jgi:predicted nucleic acid-binding protein
LLAADLLTSLATTEALVLSPQSLNECYRVLLEKRRAVSIDTARSYIAFLNHFCHAPYDFEVTKRAWRIRDMHGLAWWDCVLLASALLAKCDLFFSDDLQHEGRIDSMTIINPYIHASR